MTSHKVQIFFIHSEKCPNCEKALKVINSAIIKSKIPCKILSFIYNTDVALAIAIKHDIDDIPGIVIGGGGNVKVFKGAHYNEEQIIDAILKASKHAHK